MYFLNTPYRGIFNNLCEKLTNQFTLPVISTTTLYISIFIFCIPLIIIVILYEREQARLIAEQPKGCRKLGMKIKTNLANEFDKKFSEGRPPSSEETSAEWWRLKSLWIYPVKGCGGVELNRGTIISTGMEYDRQFTFAQLRSPFPVALHTPEKEKSAHTWECVTQKDFPRLARVRTEMWVPDQSTDTYSPHAEDVESGGVIIISFPYQEFGWRGLFAKWGAALKGAVPEMEFRVPYDPSPAQIEKSGYKAENMNIWNETITALNLEIEIPEEMRYYLGISNKLGLFRLCNTSNNSEFQSQNLEGGKPELEPISGFQDVYPIHLVNLASIRDIESKMVKTRTTPRLSAANFRANLIITGPDAYHENCWRRIKIGFYEYDVVHRTSRSKRLKSEIDGKKCQDGTIWNYRTEDEGPGLDVLTLGMNMIPLSKEAALRVGDEILLLEIDAHCNID